MVWEWKYCPYFESENSLKMKILPVVLWEWCCFSPVLPTGHYVPPILSLHPILWKWKWFENENTAPTLRVKIVWEWKYCPYFDSGAVSLLCYPLVTVYHQLRSAPTRNMNFKKCKVAKSWRDCAIDDNKNIFLMILLEKNQLHSRGELMNGLSSFGI